MWGIVNKEGMIKQNIQHGWRKAGLGSGSEHEHLHTETQRCPQHPGHNGKSSHLKAPPLQMLASSPLTSLMISALCSCWSISFHGVEERSRNYPFCFCFFFFLINSCNFAALPPGISMTMEPCKWKYAPLQDFNYLYPANKTNSHLQLRACVKTVGSKCGAKVVQPERECFNVFPLWTRECWRMDRAVQTSDLGAL